MAELRREAGTRAIGIAADVTSAEDIVRVVSEVEREFGGRPQLSPCREGQSCDAASASRTSPASPSG